MNGAESFFLKLESEKGPSDIENQTFFENFVTDETQLIDSLEKGVYWKGVVVCTKTRGRGFVSIPELDVDVMIKNFNHLNRAMDGDTVIIKILPPHHWSEYPSQILENGNFTFLNKQTGQKSFGLNQLKQNEKSTYTNEKAIETRIVDSLKDKKVVQQLSPSQSEDDSKNLILNSCLNRKSKKSFNWEEETEGYNASNSDNNFDIGKNRSRYRNLMVDNLMAKQASKLSRSSSEHDAKSLSNDEHISSNANLWDNLENVVLKKENSSSDVSDKEEEGMTIEHFLGTEVTKTEEQTTKNIKELRGSKAERIAFINTEGKLRRPIAKVINIVSS